MTTALKMQKISISAQDLIRIPTAVLKYGLVRQKKHKYSIGKWPFRFAVVTNGCIYIYNSEASKSPSSRYSLEGYNRVRRSEAKGHEWCFSILPASATDNLKPKTFACLSDTERLSWMKAIKEQLHTANKIPKHESEIFQKLRSISLTNDPEVDSYNYVEEEVFGTSGDGHAASHEGEDESDSDDSDEEKETSMMKKKTRSYSLPSNSIFYDGTTSVVKLAKSCKKKTTISETEDQAYETSDDIFLPGSSLPQPPSSPSQHKLNRISSDPTPRPPRYSEVVYEPVDEADGSENHNDDEADDNKPEHDYANLKSLQADEIDYDIPPTTSELKLEDLCTIHDLNPNRDNLIRQLRVKEPGTYLIRNSRYDSAKVLCWVGPDGQVKEFKIKGVPDKCSLDNVKHFKNLSELLNHYTNVEPILLSPELFLKRGIHRVL